MAKFRLVHTAFWNDPRVVEEMTAEDKYFFLYLLTNEKTTQVGIYQITKRQIGFDLGYSMEAVGALIQRFVEHHKLIKFNPDTREIAIKNWGKYNLVRGGKPILDCVKSELKEVKDHSLIQFVGEGIPNESIRKVFESYYVTNNDTYHVTSTIRQEIEESSNIKGSYVTSDDTSTISGQYKQQQEEKEEEKEEQQQEERGCQSLSSSFGQLAKFYEENIGPLTPMIYEDLNYLCNEFKDERLILEAFKISVHARAKNNYKFTRGVLVNWQKELVTTYEQWLVKEAREDNAKSQSNHNGQGLSRNPRKNEAEIPTVFGNYISPGI